MLTLFLFSASQSLPSLAPAASCVPPLAPSCPASAATEPLFLSVATALCLEEVTSTKSPLLLPSKVMPVV